MQRTLRAYQSLWLLQRHYRLTKCRSFGSCCDKRIQIFNRKLFKMQRANLAFCHLPFASTWSYRILIGQSYHLNISQLLRIKWKGYSREIIFFHMAYTSWFILFLRVRRVSRMPLPNLRVISISPLSPTSGGEKCVKIYLPCAKDKPTNKNTVMCSGNMFPATD